MLIDARGRVVAGTRPGEVGSDMPALTDRGDYFWRSREIDNAAGPLGVLAMDPQAGMIVSSGHTEDPRMTHFRNYGYRAALGKDFNREEIKLVLEQVIAPD